MKVRIDGREYNPGITQVKTKFTIQEVTATDSLVTTHGTTVFVTSPLLEFSFVPVSYSNFFIVSVERELSNGTVDVDDVERVSLRGKVKHDTVTLVTPRVIIEQEVGVINKPSSNSLKVNISEFKNFIGTNNVVSADWTIRNSSGEVITSRKRDIDAIRHLSIPYSSLPRTGIITVEVSHRTDEDKISYRGIADIFIDDYKNNIRDIGNIRIIAPNDMEFIPKDTTSHFLIKRLDNTVDDYVLKTFVNDILVNTEILSGGNEEFDLDTRGLTSTDKITITIETEYDVEYNGNIVQPIGARTFYINDYVLMNVKRKLDLNLTTLQYQLFKRFTGNHNFDTTNTIELSNGSIPVIINNSNIISFFTLVNGDLQSITQSDLELFPPLSSKVILGKSRVIDFGNQLLGVIFNYNDNGTILTAIKVFKYSMDSNNINLNFILIKDVILPEQDEILIGEYLPSILGYVDRSNTPNFTHSFEKVYTIDVDLPDENRTNFLVEPLDDEFYTVSVSGVKFNFTQTNTTISMNTPTNTYGIDINNSVIIHTKNDGVVVLGNKSTDRLLYKIG